MSEAEGVVIEADVREAEVDKPRRKRTPRRKAEDAEVTAALVLSVVEMTVSFAVGDAEVARFTAEERALLLPSLASIIRRSGKRLEAVLAYVDYVVVFAGFGAYAVRVSKAVAKRKVNDAGDGEVAAESAGAGTGTGTGDHSPSITRL